MSQITEKIKLGEKIGYSLGDTASNLMWMTFVFYINYFYTDVFGLDTNDLAIMLVVVRLFDAFNDPIIGILADRTNSRWGKFRPYIFWVAIPFAVIGWLTFTTPEWEYGMKLAYAYATYGLMMVVYTAINIPYSALMGVITPNIDERTQISSYRFVGANVGGLIVQGLTMFLVAYFGGGTQDAPENEQYGYSMTVFVYGVIAAILFFITFATTKERIQPPKEQKTNLKKDLGDLVRNKPWLILFLIGIFNLAFITIRNGSIMYYFKYAVEVKTTTFIIWEMSLSSAFMLVGTAGGILGIMLTSPITKIVGGKRKGFMMFMGITTILTLIYFFLPTDALIPMFILQFIINFFCGPTAPWIWAMYGDTADYSEYKNGRRATGLIFSASTAAQKLGWTIGGALSVKLLEWFGYVANDVSLDAVGGIIVLMSIAPAVAGLLATTGMFFYRLDDKYMGEIEEELKARKGDSPDVATT